jgi:hypothetical protein
MRPTFSMAMGAKSSPPRGAALQSFARSRKPCGLAEPTP